MDQLAARLWVQTRIKPQELAFTKSALSGTFGRSDIALPCKHLSMHCRACAGARQATKDPCSQDPWWERSRAQQPQAITEPQDPRTLRHRDLMLVTLLTARLQAACTLERSFPAPIACTRCRRCLPVYYADEGPYCDFGEGLLLVLNSPLLSYALVVLH